MEGYLRSDRAEEADILAQKASLALAAKASEKNPKIVREVIEKRESGVKVFVRDDNAYEIAVYPTAVHYLKAGKWADINNSLISKTDSLGTAVYENTENDIKVSFAKNTGRGSLVTLTKEKYELSWSPASSSKLSASGISISSPEAVQPSEAVSEAKISPKNLSKLEALSENEKKMVLKDISSEVTYENAFNNTDIKYRLESSYLKEKLIIKQRSQSYVFQFLLTVKNLTPSIQDNSAAFYDSQDKNNLVFTISSPFMYDSKGNYSSNAKINLIQNKGIYILELRPNAQWLASSDIVYPVTIDPTVETPSAVRSIEDSTISQGYPDTNYRDLYMLKVGYGASSYINRSFFKFQLPALNSCDLITKARLAVALNTTNTRETQINVHKVLSDWSSSTITWNNAPMFSSIIEDYTIVHGNQGEWFYWDVTDTVKDWYNVGSNYGVMLRSSNEIPNGGYYEFLSAEYSWEEGALGRPVIQIAYTDNRGVEDYWTYKVQSAGRAGTGYINDYNGSLTFIHDDLVMNGNRMPISLKHVYNQNDKSSSMGFGYGWRLNLAQRITQESFADGMRYVYVDGDGTRHYFKADAQGVYKDDSGVDLTLTPEAVGYTIKDKKDNSMYFYSDGFLRSLEDSNGNSLNLIYSEVVLIAVMDGTGRTTHLDYDSDGFLIAVRDPDGRKTSFEYNPDRQVTGITYPDGKKTVYTYDSSNRLLSATNFDGYKMSYEYYDGTTERVKVVYESNNDGTLGASLSMSYGVNSTGFLDEKGRRNYYQFNNYGNTIGIQDNEGRAQYYKYLTNEQNTSKNNKLTLESRLQSTVNNYLRNHNIETPEYWGSFDLGGSIGACTFSSEQKYMGNQSLKILKINNAGRHYFSQGVTVDRGELYTLSCYMKTVEVSKANNKGASLFISLEYRQGEWVVFEKQDYMNGSTDWTRKEISFTIPLDSYSNTAFASVGLYNESGAAYFDCFQLEKGATATRYNLIENANLTYGEDRPLFWQVNEYCDIYDKLVTGEAAPYPRDLTPQSFRINGSSVADRGLYQDINVRGVKDDILVLGGWGKARSASIGDPGKENRKFGLSIGFIDINGNTQWRELQFNTDFPDWQYASERIAAPVDFVKIRYYIMYYRNVNPSYFDGLQLYKEEFGNSFGYDDKGNIQLITDIVKQESKFEYNDNNDLIKFIDPKGYNYTYSYDDKHNLTSATSAEGVIYRFTYDAYGNPTEVNVGKDMALFIKTKAAYNTTGNYLRTITDSLGNTITYNYHLSRGTLNSIIDPKGKSTLYTYDLNNDRLLKVSKNADGQEISNSYTYENDRIKTVSHNGFSYTFNYDSLGNNTEVYAGNYSLVKNTYEERTGLLKKVLYGNNQSITNDHDDLDRLILVKYGTTEIYRYRYDAYGNLNFHEDLITGLQHSYSYDMADRLIRESLSNGDILNYYYDNNSNLSRFHHFINGFYMSTNYGYDKDNRLININYYRLHNINIDLKYDALGRFRQRIINTSLISYTTTYSYRAGLEGSSSNRVETVNNNGNIISYEHDPNGNIQSITQNNKKIKYYYNEANELIREDNEVLNKTIVYSYDAGGNILSKKEYVLTSQTPATLTRTYSCQYADSSWKDKLTSFDGKPITYDAIGNMKSYKGFTYTWQQGRRLAYLSGNGKTISYKYNDSGIRVEKTVNGVSTTYDLAGSKVAYESSGSDYMYYTYDPQGKLTGLIMNDAEYYYVRNLQGDIIGMIDDNGVQVVSYTYDSFGKLISIKDSAGNDVTNNTSHVGYKNPYRYRAYRYDNETGLYYLQSRYYDPEIGRFINADGIIGATGDLLAHNLFSYCRNNPVNGKDSTGFREVFEDEAMQLEYNQWMRAQRQQQVNVSTPNPNIIPNRDQLKSVGRTVLATGTEGSISSALSKVPDYLALGVNRAARRAGMDLIIPIKGASVIRGFGAVEKIGIAGVALTGISVWDNYHSGYDTSEAFWRSAIDVGVSATVIGIGLFTPVGWTIGASIVFGLVGETIKNRIW